jgi:hypothetical protein
VVAGTVTVAGDETSFELSRIRPGGELGSLQSHQCEKDELGMGSRCGGEARRAGLKRRAGESGEEWLYLLLLVVEARSVAGTTIGDWNAEDGRR